MPTQAEAMADGELVSCCGTKKMKPSILAELDPGSYLKDHGT